MSTTTSTAARYLTKRPREEDTKHAATADTPPTKCARTDLNGALLREKLLALVQPTGPQTPIATMHQLLTRNLSLTDKLFAKHQAEARLKLWEYFTNKVPRDLDAGAVNHHSDQNANTNVDTYLAPTQALQLKELIALALIREWLDVREVPTRLYLLPLYTTDALPSYKSWMAETVAEVRADNTTLQLHFDGLVNGAYATNNVHLLQWCLDLSDGDFQPVIPREDFLAAAAGPHKNLAYEETQAWMAANVPMGEPEASYSEAPLEES